VPEITFVKLVKEPIEDLREPSKHCVRLVNDEMQQSVQYCLRLLHVRFINLKNVLKYRFSGRNRSFPRIDAHDRR
jgi:hypothetical protein